MKIADYPPQEPLSPLGLAYHERAMAKGEGVVGRESSYRDDPYCPYPYPFWPPMPLTTTPTGL